MRGNISLAEIVPDDLYTQEQVCTLLGKSLSWAERSRWAGTGITFHKIGRRALYRGSDILAYCNAGRREIAPESQAA